MNRLPFYKTPPFFNRSSLEYQELFASLISEGFKRWFKQIAATIYLWNNRVNQRWQLSLLEDEQLNDIGKSREEAETESRKPFWKK